jgi:hypothetical protein
MAADAVRLKKRYERGVSRQAQYRTKWQTLAEYLLPNRANITRTFSPGTTTTDELFDSEGVADAQTLAHSITGSMVPASSKWLSLVVRAKALNGVKAVQDWLEEVADTTYQAMTQSNFASEFAEAMLDCVVFGTNFLYAEEADPGYLGAFGGLQYKAFPVGQFTIEEDAQGRVNAVFFRYQMPVDAVIKEWPQAAELEELKALTAQQKGDEQVWILHAIYPREQRLPGSMTRDNMPYACCYVLDEKAPTILDESGYMEFPGAGARWQKTAGEQYGRSPAWTALPDIRSLNRAVEVWLAAAGKAIDPPLGVLDDGVMGTLTLEPAGVNVMRERESIWAIESKHRLDIAVELFDRLERKIKQIFFADALRLRMKPDMTATEVMALQEEMLRLLGPTAGRLYDELLSPIVERTVAILARAGQLPPTPRELLEAADADIDIQYEGPLARAQKSADLTAIERFNMHLTNKAAATMDPSVWDVVDHVAQDLHYGAVAGVPSDTLRGKEDIAAMRDQRAQAAAEEKKLQVMAGAAEAAGKVAPLAEVARKSEQPAGKA